jgi:zinc protease
MRTLALLLAGLLTSTAAQSPDARATFPKASETNLDNGLHVVVLEDRRKPVIAFQLVIPGAGGYLDPDDQLGVAAATAALMRQGTATRSPIQVATLLEEMSARLTIEADAASPDAVISGSCPADQATKLLDLATDILLHPAFDEIP